MATRARPLTDTFGFTYAETYGEGFGNCFPNTEGGFIWND